MHNLCWFVFLLNICWGLCADDLKHNNNCQENCDKDLKVIDDKKSDIWRPCPKDDINCIRNFFGHNSKCTPVYGPAKDPYKLKTSPFVIAQVNVTFDFNHYEVKGFNKFKIEEFYVNKATNALVLEVVFENLLVYAGNTAISYFEKGKDPTIIEDYSTALYKGISFTLTLFDTKNNGMNPSNGVVFTYLSDPAPWYGVGPNISENKNPQVIRANAELLGKVNLSLRESFVVQGPIYFNIFFNSLICNFKYEY